MKKNVLRILLALVLVSLVVALVACDPGGEEHTTCVDTNPKDGKCDVCGKTVAHTCVDTTPEDGKCDVCGKTVEPTNDGGEVTLSGEINKLLTTLNPYIDALKGITADGNVGLDIGIGAYLGYEDVEDALNSWAYGFGIDLAANASKTDPELKLAIKAGEKNDMKDYFGLGYADSTLYLLEGLNLINTSATSSNKIAMDVSYLESGVLNAVGVGVDWIAEKLPGMLGGIDLTAIAGSLTGANGGSNFLEMFESFISVSSSDDGVSLTIDETNMALVLNMLPSLLGDMSAVDGVINTVVGVVGDMLGDNETVAEILGEIEGKGLFDILKVYAPALSINAAYEGTGDDVAIKGLDVVIGIPSLGVELGITIDLNTISITEKAAISFSGYKAQDLKGQVSLDLGYKGIDAVLDLVVNTSDAFEEVNNNIASGRIMINGVNAGYVAFDGQTVYLDLNPTENQSNNVKGLFDILGGTTDNSKYYYSLEENVKTTILNALNGIGAPSADNADTAEEEVDLVTGIYNMLAGMLGVETEDSVEFADFLNLVDPALVLADEYAGDYLKIDLVDDQGAANSLESIWAQIVAIHTENASKLEGVATASGTEAGVQLIGAGEDGVGILDYVAAYILIPAITDDGELDFETEAEINDKETLTGYVTYVFSLYTGDSDYINGELVGKLLGIGYAGIIDNGVYAYAGYNDGEGLSGYVGVKASATAEKTYIELGADIGFGTATSYTSVPSDLTGAVLFTEKVDANDENSEYKIFETMWNLLDAFLAYTPAE